MEWVVYGVWVGLGGTWSITSDPDCVIQTESYRLCDPDCVILYLSFGRRMP